MSWQPILLRHVARTHATIASLLFLPFLAYCGALLFHTLIQRGG
jgi:hypothetical protein